MAKSKTKTVQVLVTLKVNPDLEWGAMVGGKLNAVGVRREVKHLINDGVGYFTQAGDNIKAIKVERFDPLGGGK